MAWGEEQAGQCGALCSQPDLYLRQENFDQAILLLKDLVKGQPRNQHLQYRLCHAIYYQDQTKHAAKDAKRCLKKASKHVPKDDQYYLHMLMGQVEQNLDRALKAFSEAALLRPESADAHHNSGVTLSRLGLHAKAASSFIIATQLEPTNFESLMECGHSYLAAKKPADAAEAYTKALAIAPQSPLPQHGLGQALMLQRNFQEALTCFERALQQAPRDSDHLHSAGIAAWRTGRTHRALKYWDKATRHEPGRSDSWTLLRLGAHELSKKLSGTVQAEKQKQGCPDDNVEILEGRFSLDFPRGDLSAERVETALSTLWTRGGLLIKNVLDVTSCSALHSYITNLIRNSSHSSFDTTRSTFESHLRLHYSVPLTAPPVHAALGTVSRALWPFFSRALQVSGRGRGKARDPRLVESGVIVSYPGSNAQRIHADTDESDGDGHCYKMQIATEDIDTSMGPIEVVFGSQAGGFGASEDAIPVPVELPKGSVFIYDSTVHHRGGANKSRKSRLVYYVTLLPAFGQFPLELPYTIQPDEAGRSRLTSEGGEVLY